MKFPWESEVAIARTKFAWIKREDRAVLLIGGKDRVKFLQGMISNDVNRLLPGQSMLASMLSHKGRLIAEFVLHNLGESLALESDRSLQPTIESNFLKYVLGAEVTFSSRSNEHFVLNLFGPDAEKILAPLRSDTTFAAQFDFPASPTFTLLVPKEKASTFEKGLEGAPLSTEAYEALRIESGIPRFGVDVTEDQLLLEVPHLVKGISFTKGCYVGQETVARLHARGENVARRLMGVAAESEIKTGDIVHYGRQEVGNVTSVSYSPGLLLFLGLALLHREAFEPGTTVLLPSGVAKVVSLPFA